MPIINMQATGQNIKRMMKDRGMTVKDVQEIFGFTTTQAVYKWIWGKTLPSIDNMVVIAKIFNVKIDDIIIIQ